MYDRSPGSQGTRIVGDLITTLFLKLYRAITQPGGQPPDTPRTAEANDKHCKLDDYIGSFFQNYARQGLEAAMNMLPKSEWKWKILERYEVKLEQAAGKDGIFFVFTIEDTETGEELVRHKFSKKGGEVPILSNLPVAGGHASITIRFGGNLVPNEVTFQYQPRIGSAITYKLKPKPCELDPAQRPDRQARLNEGSSALARANVEDFAFNAMLQNYPALKDGALTPVLFNLLNTIEPVKGVNGVHYRNHGSHVLAAITRPLNALQRAGYDPAGRLREIRQAGGQQAVVRWFQTSLNKAIANGEIRPDEVSNVFGLNLGVSQLVGQKAPLPTSVAPPPQPSLPLNLNTLTTQLRDTGLPLASIRQERNGHLVLTPSAHAPEGGWSVVVIQSKLARVLGLQPDNISVIYERDAVRVMWSR